MIEISEKEDVTARYSTRNLGFECHNLAIVVHIWSKEAFCLLERENN